MIKFIIPEEKYLLSFKEAKKEYEYNNVTAYVLDDPDKEDIFKKYDDFRNERNLPLGFVGSDEYWLVDEERNYFIGKVSIRHKLNQHLERLGGHIGYAVRFGEWNKGYGTLMLKLALEKAKEMGIKEVLVTCNDENVGSYTVMEKNGMSLKDKIPNVDNGKEIITRRYIKVL